MLIQDQIRNSIENFAAELDALVRRAAVETVAQALETDGAGAPWAHRGTAGTSVRATRPRRKGQKRDPKELEQLTNRLLMYVTKNKGHRIEQIANGMGTTTKELALPAKKLIANKNIRKASP